MAVVIDFAAGAERFRRPHRKRYEERATAVADREQREREVRARLVLARERELLDQESREARERWLSDLATWPRAFRQALRVRVEGECSPERVRYDWGVPCYAERRSGRAPRCTLPDTFELDALEHLRALSRAARDRRLAKPHERGDRLTPRERLNMEKRELLRTLWSWGHRRIDRATLRAVAAEKIAERRRSAISHIQSGATRTAVLRGDLARGTCKRGPRKGMPYSVVTRYAMERSLAQDLQWIEECRRSTAIIDSQPDPLRAWVMQ